MKYIQLRPYVTINKIFIACSASVEIIRYKAIEQRHLKYLYGWYWDLCAFSSFFTDTSSAIVFDDYDDDLRFMSKLYYKQKCIYRHISMEMDHNNIYNVSEVAFFIPEYILLLKKKLLKNY